MAATPEGVRRLSLFAGGIGAILWFVYVLVESNGFSKMGTPGWPIGGSMVVGVICFIVPFLFVRAVAWVVAGFKQRKE